MQFKTATVRLKSKEVKKAKGTYRVWDERVETFVEMLYDVLNEVSSDLESEDGPLMP